MSSRVKAGRTDRASPGWLGLVFSVPECGEWTEQKMQLRCEREPHKHRVKSWANFKQVLMCFATCLREGTQAALRRMDGKREGEIG